VPISSSSNTLVVDQQRQRGERGRRRNEAAQRLRVGEIGQHHVGLPAGFGDFPRHRFGVSARRIGVQHHGVTGARQSKRDRGADTAAAAGDQGRARRALGAVRRHEVSMRRIFASRSR
jgi:hypothetical protein